jgi:GNAT superfamily N-acetyltransferase
LRLSAGANFTPEADLTPLLAGYRVRPAQAEDGLGLRAVELRAIRLVAATFYTPVIARSWTSGVTPSMYAAALEAGRWIDAAVDLQGHIVGFSMHHEARLEALFVEPNKMKHGIGSALLARAEKLVRSAEHTAFEADVPLGAVDFFSHRGYRTSAVKEKAARGGFLMPMHQMTKILR